MKGTLKRLERGEGTALLTLEVQCSAEESSELRRQMAAGPVELELGPAVEEDNEPPSHEDEEEKEADDVGAEE